MSKELENLIPDNPLDCLKTLRTSANSYCSFNNAQCEYNKELADNIEKALKRLEVIDNARPNKALECLNKIVESFNETTGLGEVVVANDLIYNFEEELDTIKQALIQANQYLGARRNSKTLAKMYQLVLSSEKLMKPALWIGKIDGKLQFRVIMEKKDYDKLQIKAQEQEEVLKVIFEKPKQSEAAIVYIRATIRPSYEDYCLVIKDEYRLTEEEFDLLNKISKDIRGE